MQKLVSKNNYMYFMLININCLRYKNKDLKQIGLMIQLKKYISGCW